MAMFLSPCLCNTAVCSDQLKGCMRPLQERQTVLCTGWCSDTQASAMAMQGGGPLTGTADELPEGRGHALIASICSAGAPCGMQEAAWLPARASVLRTTALAASQGNLVKDECTPPCLSMEVLCRRPARGRHGKRGIGSSGGGCGGGPPAAGGAGGCGGGALPGAGALAGRPGARALSQKHILPSSCCAPGHPPLHMHSVHTNYFAHRESPLSKCFELKVSTAVNARSSARGARLTTASAGQRRPPTRRSCSAGRRCARWQPWSPWAARLPLRLPRGHLTVRRVRRAAAQTTRGHPHSGSRTHARQQAGATAESLVPVRALRLRRRHPLLLLQAGEAQACRRSCARMFLPRPGTWVMRCAGCCTSCCWRRRTGLYSTASRSWRGDMRGLSVALLRCTQGRAVCTS